MVAIQAEPLLTPFQLSEIYMVNVKTCTRWAKAGKFYTIRTPGGHRRFFENETKAALRGEEWLPAAYARAAENSLRAA